MCRLNYWVFISCPTFVLFRHYSISGKLQLREYLQVKSSRKSKRIPAYGLLQFYWEICKKFDAGNRCCQCINNVIKLCYYLSGSFLCFQVLTAYWTAFGLLWWLNWLSSHVRLFFPNPDRYRGAGSRRCQRWWWPSWPLSINGRVAGQQGAAHIPSITFHGLFSIFSADKGGSTFKTLQSVPELSYLVFYFQCWETPGPGSREVKCWTKTLSFISILDKILNLAQKSRLPPFISRIKIN